MRLRFSIANLGNSGDFGNLYEVARRNNRRASSCHRERAAKPGVERSKPAKPTLCPSACVPSARDPPPIDAMLKAKGKPKFDSTVDRTVEASFWPFSPVKSVSLNRSFSRCNPLLTHRSAVGRTVPKLRGAKTAALRTVIVSERRSRETNDLKPEPQILADC